MSANLEEFKKESNSRLKFFRDEYAKKLEGIFPTRKRKSQQICNTEMMTGADIDLKFKEFVNQLFTKCNQSLAQSSSVIYFCKQFGMDRELLLSLNSFDQKQEYLLSCISKQAQNQATTETSQSKQKKDFKTQKKQNNWMHLNTKHQFLQNKIREAFMQALNQEGNQSKIDQFVKDFNQRKTKDDSKIPKLKLNKITESDSQKLQVISANWDNETEAKLKDKINLMKNELRDANYSRKLGRQRYITKEEYMMVAYSEIMRTLNQHKQYNMDRDTILKKYLQREIPLTEAEMKFILNTSPLITKSLNKTKIKTAIQNLDPAYLHSIQIKIADQVLNQFTSSINQVKKSRKNYKKETLNSILNKLHNIQKASQRKNLDSRQSPAIEKQKITPFGNEHQSKLNLIHKYSGGIDSIKKIKQKRKITEVLPKEKENRFLRRSINHFTDKKPTLQRPQTVHLSKSYRSNKGNITTQNQAQMKRRKQFLIKSLQVSALRNNFQWVIVENYPSFTPQQVNSPDRQGNTPLYYVIKNQNQEFCMYLLKCGANVNYVCQKGQTPLHMAFKSNNHNIISSCLMKNPDLNAVCNKGFTPLAHGKIATLKAFGLMNGVPKCNPNEPKFFDNNRLLTLSNKPNEQQHSELIY